MRRAAGGGHGVAGIAFAILFALVRPAEAQLEGSDTRGASLAEPSAHAVAELVEPDEEIPLPGTQPFQHGAGLQPARAHVTDGSGTTVPCVTCHGNYDSGSGAGSAADGPFDG